MDMGRHNGRGRRADDTAATRAALPGGDEGTARSAAEIDWSDAPTDPELPAVRLRDDLARAAGPEWPLTARPSAMERALGRARARQFSLVGGGVAAAVVLLAAAAALAANAGLPFGGQTHPPQGIHANPLPSATAFPTATPTTAPTPTPLPTATPIPTATPEPTATPIATPEDTPEPDATASATATPAPTPLPTATSIPTRTPAASPRPSPSPTAPPAGGPDSGAG